MIKPIEEFVKRRNEALFSLDRDKILKFYESAYGKTEMNMLENVDERTFWASVYKAICNITSAPEDLKSKAEKWLNENGFTVDIKRLQTMPESDIIKTLVEAIRICELFESDYIDGVELELLTNIRYLILRKNAEIEALKNSKSEAIKKFAERVVIAFYYEFDECIPSSMAEKIDEIVKEMTEGENGAKMDGRDKDNA